MTKEYQQEVGIDKNQEVMELTLNGLTQMGFDRGDQRIYGVARNSITYKWEYVSMANYADIDYICYVIGKGDLMGGTSIMDPTKLMKLIDKEKANQLMGAFEVSLSGVGFKTKNNKYYHGMDCDYETYQELIPHIQEYVGKIPVYDRQVESSSLKQARPDNSAWILFMGMAAIIGVLMLVFQALGKF